MNDDLKKIWLSRFPFWPESLLIKFEQGIFIDSLELGYSGSLSFKQWYEENINLKRTFSLGAPVGQIYPNWNIFSPSNPQFTVSESPDFGPRFYFALLMPTNFFPLGALLDVPTNLSAPQEIPVTYFRCRATFNFDSRLFYPWNAYALYVYYTDEGRTQISVLSVMNYDTVFVNSVIPEVLIAFANQAKPYSGADSIFALYENGIHSPDVNYDLLIDFITYRNAYLMASAQIESAANVARKNASADLLNYSSDLNSKIVSQKNDLQNLTLQLSNQMQSEVSSTKRDLTTLTMQALSLKLQLTQALKK